MIFTYQSFLIDVKPSRLKVRSNTNSKKIEEDADSVLNIFTVPSFMAIREVKNAVNNKL